MQYILDGHVPVPCEDLLEWARWMETTDRIVARDNVGPGHGVVSTVFMGLNHNFHPDGEPLFFETLVFGGPLDGEQDRYTSWPEAEAGHARMVSRVKAAAP